MIRRKRTALGKGKLEVRILQHGTDRLGLKEGDEGSRKGNREIHMGDMTAIATIAKKLGKYSKRTWVSLTRS